MLKELDVVSAKNDLCEEIKRGTKGVVVLVLNHSPNIYEVEFVDEKNDFIALMSVKESDLKSF